MGQAPAVDRRALRAAFVEQRGFWAPPFESILQLAPDFLRAYLDFSAVPWRNGALEPKVKELIYLAVDASTTHLHADGTRAHIAGALRRGATPEEIVEVVELTSVLGIHSATLAFPILVEELAKAGTPVGPITERQQQIKDRFIRVRGLWAGAWDAILAVAPDFLDAYTDFSGLPWTSGVLEPKVKELIYVAIDAATTHLHVDGTRAHLREALRHGAAPEEIVEVIELVSVLGMHSATMAMPILVEELARA